MKKQRKAPSSKLYYYAVQSDSHSANMDIKLFKLGGKINAFNRKLELMQLQRPLVWNVLIFDYNGNSQGLYTDVAECKVSTPLTMGKIDTTKLVSNMVYDCFTQDEINTSSSRVYFIYPNIKDFDAVAMVKERRVQMAMSEFELNDIIKTPYEEHFNVEYPL